MLADLAQSLAALDADRFRRAAHSLKSNGNTFGALSVGGHPARRGFYEPMLMPHVSHVSPCFAFRFKAPHESSAQYVTRLAAELDAEFQRVGPGRVMAFIAEPVVGATSGCVPAEPGYFQAIREVCAAAICRV